MYQEKTAYASLAEALTQLLAWIWIRSSSGAYALLTLSSLEPESTMQKEHQQAKESKSLCSFQPGDHLAVHQFWGPKKGAIDAVVQCLGPVGYMIQMAHKTCRNMDHLTLAPDTTGQHTGDSDPS